MANSNRISFAHSNHTLSHSGGHSHSHSHSHGHSHHHSSHHRHKRRKAGNNNRREKIAIFLRRNKHYLIYTAMTIVFLICLVLVGGHMDRQGEGLTDRPGGTQNSEGGVKDPSSENASANGSAVGTIQINIPLFSGEVDIVAPTVRAFLNLDDGISIESYYDTVNAQTRLDVSLPVELYYETTELPAGCYVKSAEFLVADNAEFRNPQVVQTNAGVTSVDFYNLKTGTQYYYRINLQFTNGGSAQLGGSFCTANGPRLMMVDGVRNIRDIGGWMTVDGKMVKQGLLYRGRELDGAVRSDYTITAQGVHTMVTQLGIKTDMDLRQPTDNKYGTDALGQGVKHIYYSAPMYGNIFNSAENSETIRQIFSDLANPSNYPIYMHCTHGLDRTGTVSYLLGALLGVDADGLLTDYQLSVLAHGEVSEYMDDFLILVDALPGLTLRDKVEGYLLSIGVTVEEIASIRQIFLEN